MMFIFENPQISDILAAYLPILYAGVMSCGVAYTLQIIGQKNANPAVASLILSLESCFSVLAGWVVLGEKLSVRESSMEISAMQLLLNLLMSMQFWMWNCALRRQLLSR
jgi:drug/metabolite transporter (DMT)-like permease